MKLIDKNGRLFGRVSVIDALVILVVAVLALALHFKGGQTHTGSVSAQQDIQFQVMVPGIREFVADAVQEGDPLWELDRESGGALGEIVEIEVIVPGTKLEELDDGTVETVPLENCVNLLLTVRGKGVVSEGHILLNRVYDLGVNASRTFCTPYAQFLGNVWTVTPSEPGSGS